MNLHVFNYPNNTKYTTLLQDKSAKHHFKTDPGFISTGVESLKAANIDIVNIGFDEKSLAGAVTMEEVDGNFSVKGDIDYGLPEINKDKIELISNLNYWHNCAEIVKPSAYIFLTDLHEKLCEQLGIITKSLQSLRGKYSINKVSIAKETSSFATTQSSLKEVEKVLKTLIIKSVLETEEASFDNNEKVTVQIKNIIQYTGETQQAGYPTDKLYILAGFGGVADMRKEWKKMNSVSQPSRSSVSRSVKDLENLKEISLFLQLYDATLKICRKGNDAGLLSGHMFLITDLTYIQSDLISQYVYCSLENMEGSNLLNVFCQMCMNQKPAMVSIKREDFVYIYIFEYTDVIINLINTILSNLLAQKQSSKRISAMVNSKHELDSFPLPSCLAKVPCSLSSVETRDAEEKIVIHVPKHMMLLDIEERVKEVIRKAVISLRQPALHVLVVVANSVFGKEKGHVSDVPIFYCRTGRGCRVKQEISYIIKSCIQYLANQSIKVVCVSADTANHNITHVNWDGEPNNIVGLKFAERSKYFVSSKYAVDELLKVLPKSEEEFRASNIPGTWTFKPKEPEDWSDVLNIEFRQMGDFTDEEAIEVLNVPMSELEVPPQYMEKLFQERTIKPISIDTRKVIMFHMCTLNNSRDNQLFKMETPGYFSLLYVS